jgi:anionic cell wall polymer biosynthesis LytR-Cps2A-Psr (LCP) family protein
LRSFPRDAPTRIPGHGRGEIGATFTMGGPDLTRRSITRLVGVRVPYYCVVSTEGIREIVGSMGGVRIKVPRAMNGRCPAEKG